MKIKSKKKTKSKIVSDKSFQAKSKILKFAKMLGWTILVLLSLAILIFAYMNLPASLPSEKPNLGVTFSMRYARDIGLDWKQAYLAALDELELKRIRIPAYWDLIEKTEGSFDFSDLDWQLVEAKKRGAKVVLAVGQKVPRWPECYVPKWIGKDDKQKRETRLLVFVEKVMERYKGAGLVAVWQIENEPFLSFGDCPVFDVNLLDREIVAAKKTDPDTPLMLTDSGELGLWVPAAKRGDMFGTTMYREVVTKKYGAWTYPIGPNFFKLKRLLVGLLADQKNISVIELQGEPWLDGWTTGFPLEAQFKSMNSQKLQDNVAFARKTGIRDIYVWGVEWWYWLKVSQGHPELWEKAKNIFVD